MENTKTKSAMDINSIITNMKGPYNYQDAAGILEKATEKTYDVINQLSHEKYTGVQAIKKKQVI